MYKDNSSLSVTDLESIVRDATTGQNALQKIDRTVNIHIHSVRKKLADPDGISAKASIDSLIATGLLQDDSAQYVEQVTFSQEKGRIEYTEIEIQEVG